MKPPVLALICAALLAVLPPLAHAQATQGPNIDLGDNTPEVTPIIDCSTVPADQTIQVPRLFNYNEVYTSFSDDYITSKTAHFAPGANRCPYFVIDLIFAPDSAWPTFPEGFPFEPRIVFAGWNLPGTVSPDLNLPRLPADCDTYTGNFIVYEDIDGTFVEYDRGRTRARWQSDRCTNSRWVIYDRIRNPVQGTLTWRFAIRARVRNAWQETAILFTPTEPD